MAAFKETGASFRAKFGTTQFVNERDYEKLINHPRVMGNVLIGDKTFMDLGLGEITPQEIDDIFDEMIYGG